jgi:hypothetical protein
VAGEGALSYRLIDEDDIRYDSGKLPLPDRAGTRSFTGGNKGHYIFQVRSGGRRNSDEYVVIEFHSSVTANALKRGKAWGTVPWDGAATTVVMNRKELQHLLAAVLAVTTDKK